MPFADRDDVVQAFTSNLGIVLVARRAGSVSVDEDAKMTSTFMRASSATASCICSTVPDLRNSMTRFLPSTYPRSRKPARSASTRFAEAAGAPNPRYPSRATLTGCCARATRGHENNAAPAHPINARRLTVRLPFRRCQSHHDPSLSLCLPNTHAQWPEGEHRERPARWSVTLGSGSSVNHLIRAQQERLRDREPERLRGLEIDHQIELPRLLDREIGGRRAPYGLFDGGSPAAGQG